MAKMYMQGVVRILQNRMQAGEGPLPVSELEREFKALWKVPFNMQQIGEVGPVHFCQGTRKKSKSLMTGHNT